MKKHIVIYSHGFGVGKDGRGLFSDIANKLSSAQAVMFDYNQVEEEQKTLTVVPLDKQAQKLQTVILDVMKSNPTATIDLICHSQGCIVAAIAKPVGIRKTIFLAPPAHFDIERLLKLFGDRPGTEVNIEGVTRLARRDGTTTIVPREYWQGLGTLSLVDLYNDFAGKTELVIISANQDEVLGTVNFDDLRSSVRVIPIDGKHDFDKESRGQLTALLQRELIAL